MSLRIDWLYIEVTSINTNVLVSGFTIRKPICLRLSHMSTNYNMYPEHLRETEADMSCGGVSINLAIVSSHLSMSVLGQPAICIKFPQHIFNPQTAV